MKMFKRIPEFLLWIVNYVSEDSYSKLEVVAMIVVTALLHKQYYQTAVAVMFCGFFLSYILCRTTRYKGAKGSDES